MPDAAVASAPASAHDGAVVPAALLAGGALAERIEDAALAATQPAQQAFFDGWLLRHAAGRVRRTRSVNALAQGRLPLNEKLEYCEAFYARHAMATMFRVTPFRLPPGTDAALAARGYAIDGETRVMALDLAQTAPVTLPMCDVQCVDATAYATIYAQLHRLSPATADVERERFERNAAATRYAVIVAAGTAVACGSAAVDGALVGVFGMITAEAQRGRGLARALIAALLAEARAAGVATAYLQVEADNAPARRVYHAFGFSDCYAYWYRMQPRVVEGTA